MSGLLDTIRSAKLPERSIELCLRGDLSAEYDALERRLAEVTKRDATSFAGSGETPGIIARMDEIQTQMSGAMVTFRLRALGTLASATLMAEHPPRDGNVGDQSLGYNPETFYDARIVACCYELAQGDETLSVIEADDWERMLRALSLKQYDDLFGTAWMLDHADFAVPTSRLASLISQRTGETSNLHGAGESVPEGSQDGSPSGSPSASTTTPGDSFA